MWGSREAVLFVCVGLNRSKSSMAALAKVGGAHLPACELRDTIFPGLAVEETFAAQKRSISPKAVLVNGLRYSSTFRLTGQVDLGPSWSRRNVHVHGQTPGILVGLAKRRNERCRNFRMHLRLSGAALVRWDRSPQRYGRLLTLRTSFCA